MPRVFFMVQDDSGDGLSLCFGDGKAIEVEAIPRVGDHVSFYGPQFGTSKEDGSTFFVVDRVHYQLAIGPDGRSYVESECPNVWLREDEPEHSFRPKCVCINTRVVDPDDPRRCDNCGDRIPLR